MKEPDLPKSLNYGFRGLGITYSRTPLIMMYGIFLKEFRKVWGLTWDTAGAFAPRGRGSRKSRESSRLQSARVGSTFRVCGLGL